MKSFFDKNTMEFLKERGNTMSAGQQLHFNHANCPAGIDMKNRLYIKVSDDGKMVLGYCHHCGSRGAARRHRFVSEGVPKVINNDNEAFNMYLGIYHRATPMNELPFHFYKNIMEIKPLVGLLNDPSNYHSRSNSKNMDTFVVENGYYGTKTYHEAAFIGLILVPIWTEDNNISGIICRYAGDKGKWLIFKEKDIDGSYKCGKMVMYNTYKSDTVVICEDIISAMKIDFAGYAGCALMGTNCDSADLLKLSILFKRCVVWLDNDNAIVIKKADEIHNTAKMFFDDTTIVSGGDPKHYTTGQIKERIS